MRLSLNILNFVLFFAVLIAPFYIPELAFTKTIFTYLTTFGWFTLILIIGFKVALSYFLIVLYIAMLFIYFSYGMDLNALIAILSGVIASVLLYFSRSMDIK